MRLHFLFLKILFIALSIITIQLMTSKATFRRARITSQGPEFMAKLLSGRNKQSTKEARFILFGCPAARKLKYSPAETKFLINMKYGAAGSFLAFLKILTTAQNMSFIYTTQRRMSFLNWLAPAGQKLIQSVCGITNWPILPAIKYMFMIWIPS